MLQKQIICVPHMLQVREIHKCDWVRQPPNAEAVARLNYAYWKEGPYETDRFLLVAVVTLLTRLMSAAQRRRYDGRHRRRGPSDQAAQLAAVVEQPALRDAGVRFREHRGHWLRQANAD